MQKIKNKKPEFFFGKNVSLLMLRQLEMNIRFFFLLWIIAMLCSCGGVTDRIDFLRSHGILETQKVPVEMTEGSGWKNLAGDYVYFLDVFAEEADTKMMYILGNKKTGELLEVYNLNPHIMPASYALAVNPPTMVTNWTEISPVDKAKDDDMSELNSLFRKIPEMKNFSWKNELQNRIASSVILKTHFIFINSQEINTSLFTYSEMPVKQSRTKELHRIYKDNYKFFHRAVERLNESVEFRKYIEKLNFAFFNPQGMSKVDTSQDTFINDLFPDNPINFKGKGKMFFFFPFKSFQRAQDPHSGPVYDPSIATFMYTYTLDTDGFPVFKRETRYVNILSHLKTAPSS
jgi:hypothetical protein